MYSLLIGNLIKKAMVRSVFKTMGYKNVEWISYTSVKRVGHQKRVQWLRDIKRKLAR